MKRKYIQPMIEVYPIDEKIYEGEILSNTKSPQKGFDGEGDGDDIAADEDAFFDWDNSNWGGWDD